MKNNLKLIFQYIRKESNAQKTQIEDTMDDETLLQILINRKWKKDHYKENEITDLETCVYANVCEGIKIYSNTISQNEEYYHSQTLPYPELNLTLQDFREQKDAANLIN